MAKLIVQHNQAEDLEQSKSNLVETPRAIGWVKSIGSLNIHEEVSVGVAGQDFQIPSTVGQGMGRRVISTGHGLVVGKVLRLRAVGSVVQWTLAKSTPDRSLFATHMVVAVKNANTFDVAQVGAWKVSGFANGDLYLSDSVPGSVSATAPTSNPVQRVGIYDGVSIHLTFDAWSAAAVGRLVVGVDYPTFKECIDSAVSGSVIEIPAGYRIAEDIAPSIIPSGITIQGDSGSPAIFDAFDDYVATWTKEPGYTNIWKATINHKWGGISSAYGSTRLAPQCILGEIMMVEKRGALNLTTLDASLGSFAVVGKNGGSYATGWWSGDQTYYVSSAVSPAFLRVRIGQRSAPGFGTGNTVSNITCFGGIHRDGLGAKNCSLSNIRIYYPTGHGCIVGGCKVQDIEVGYGNPSCDTGFAIHGYSATWYPLIHIIRPFVHNWVGGFCSVFGCHGSDGNDMCELFLIEDARIEEAQTLMGMQDATTVRILRMKAERLEQLGGSEKAIEIEDSTLNGDSLTNGFFSSANPMRMKRCSVSTGAILFRGSGSPMVIEIEDSKIVSGYDSTNNRWQDQIPVNFSATLTRCMVSCTAMSPQGFSTIPSGYSLTLIDTRWDSVMTLPPAATLSGGSIVGRVGLSRDDNRTGIKLTREEEFEQHALDERIVAMAAPRFNNRDSVLTLTNKRIWGVGSQLNAPAVSGGLRAVYLHGTGRNYAIFLGTNILGLMSEQFGSYSTYTVSGWDGTVLGAASKEDGSLLWVDASGAIRVWDGATTVTVTAAIAGFTPLDVIWSQASYGPAGYVGIYLMMGTSGGVTVFYSSPDGVTWTLRTGTIASTALKNVRAATGGFIVTGTCAAGVYRSTDLATWTDISPPYSFDIVDAMLLAESQDIWMLGKPLSVTARWAFLVLSVTSGAWKVYNLPERTSYTAMACNNWSYTPHSFKKAVSIIAGTTGNIRYTLNGFGEVVALSTSRHPVSVPSRNTYSATIPYRF